MSFFDVTQCDALDWLRFQPSGSIHAFIIDLPYESLEKHRKRGTTTRLSQSKASSNAWFSIFPYDRFDELFGELYRVLCTDAHLYFFCDQETMFVAKPIGEVQGFTFWKPIVWDKVSMGMGYHYRARYELILFFEKGKRRLNDLGVPDILTAKRIRGGYPAEKPVELLRTLVRQSTYPGERVCDVFFGSGATGVACITEGREFVGCDVAEDAVVLARRRLLDAGGIPADRRAEVEAFVADERLFDLQPWAQRK